MLIGLLTGSCHDQYSDPKLNETYDIAGRNKSELKAVLAHFRQTPKDSLQLKSALFLIENMRWHQGDFLETPDFLIKNLIREDSLVKKCHQELSIPKWKRSLVNTRRLDSFQIYEKPDILTQAKLYFNTVNASLPDPKRLSSKFLIQHIKHAHKAWEQHKKTLNIDYNTFQTSILPYRISAEPVVAVHNLMYNRYYDQFFKDLNQLNRDSLIQNSNSYLSFFGGKGLEQLQIGSFSFLSQGELGCFERTVAVVNFYRNLGFPTELDFTPIWLDNPNRHYWCKMPFKNSSSIYFDAQSRIINNQFKNRCLGKVYRRQFSANPDAPFFHKSKNEELPSIFSSPCILDVTAEYLPSQTTTIALNNFPEDLKNCYLCVFFPSGWTPLAYGKIDPLNKTSIYKDITTDITVASCIYKNGKMHPISDLYYIDKHWNPIRFTPKPHQKIKLSLQRKYPWKKRMMEYATQFVGARFQGANNADFSDAEDLDIIQDTLKPKVHLYNGSKGRSFRYYRFLPAKKWLKCQASELQFIGKDTALIETATPLQVTVQSIKEQTFLREISGMKAYKGTVIGAGKDMEKCFDRDILTFSLASWCGMDFGTPIAVDKILFAPRNGDNGILPGDSYQIFYWDNGWKQGEKKVASYHYLDFEDIPAGTLYWLRNLSSGKEELPFIYHNEEQYFSNFDSLNLNDSNPKHFELGKEENQ